jgi:hypothetical protein
MIIILARIANSAAAFARCTESTDYRKTAAGNSSSN